MASQAACSDIAQDKLITRWPVVSGVTHSARFVLFVRNAEHTLVGRINQWRATLGFFVANGSLQCHRAKNHSLQRINWPLVYCSFINGTFDKNCHNQRNSTLNLGNMF